jgi:hypothetical protein
MNLPALVMPETGDASSDQVAKIGRLDHVSASGGTVRYRLTTLRCLPSEHVEPAATALGIDRFEFSRHHWAVKDADLYAVLFDRLLPTPEPRVFTFPAAPQESDLVAVMMPFSPGFDRIYAALQDAVATAGLRCQRADDIWDNDAVIDDIAALIWRSRVVISDVTGKNANVFYETGIAHTLGRDVIVITQSARDVPLDVQHLRFQHYLANGEGLDQLKDRLVARLHRLTGRP